MDAKSNDLRGVPTIADAIGLEVLEVNGEQVKGRLPVDHRTHQPYGLLHGGASVVLAETLGSVGSHYLVADQNKAASEPSPKVKAAPKKNATVAAQQQPPSDAERPI